MERWLTQLQNCPKTSFSSHMLSRLPEEKSSFTSNIIYHQLSPSVSLLLLAYICDITEGPGVGFGVGGGLGRGGQREKYSRISHP